MKNRQCSVTGCTRSWYCKDYCTLHYQRSRRGVAIGGPESYSRQPLGLKCSVRNCQRKPWARLYCTLHYSRWRRSGHPGPAELLVGEHGLGTFTSEGYRVIPTKNGKALEHRVIMERLLGRKLERFENVHHRNGLRSDNRPENLELWAKPQTIGQRVSDLVNWVVDNYGPEVQAELERRRSNT